MTMPVLRTMTPDEFLIWCLDQPEKWELEEGVPIRMMTGATRRHDRVVVNIISELRGQLRGGPCTPHTADIAAHIPRGNVRRPDVTVDCAKGADSALSSQKPTAFFEVLSPSTRTFDLLKKTDEYKTVPSLRHIVMIDPTRAHVLIWSREGETDWIRSEVADLSGDVPLAALGISLPLTEIYDGVTLEAE